LSLLIFATFRFKIIDYAQDKSIHLGGVESQLYNIGYIFKYDLDDYEGKIRVRYLYDEIREADYSYISMY
jgi:hypothetical protein